MHIGERIKAKRISLGWSQRDLAEKMGYKNHSVIARIESGKVDINQTRLDQFATVLGLSHGYLLGLVTEAQSAQNTEVAKNTLKMTKDPDYLEACSDMRELSAEDFAIVKGLLTSLRKKYL